MKLSDIKAGDIVVTDSRFTCMTSGKHIVYKNGDGFYLLCSHGRHYLDGQIDDETQELVGITKAS